MTKEETSLIKAILTKRMLICVFNGFTAGLPLYYVYQLVPAWLRSEGVDLKTIGLFSVLGLAYNWKFIWSPIMDRYTPPFLGRRRGWMIITQVALMLLMYSLSAFDPKITIWAIVGITAAIAFFSASQDITLDAYRRELLPDNELGLGSAVYANAYRVAGFIPGGLGLILADQVSWPTVHFIIGSFMLVGITKTLLISEAAQKVDPPKSLKAAVVEPFVEFFKRDGLKIGLLILAFMFLYKIGDNMATALQMPFFLDMGFSKTVIGVVVKAISFWAMVAGGFIGGGIIYKYGINKSLWLFGFVQMGTILGFALLSIIGNNTAVLSIAVAGEYLGVGLGTSALMAFMARATNVNFTATQFALFSSLIALPRTFSGAITGFLIEGVKPTDGFYYEFFGAWSGMGYTHFFILCTFMAIPGIVLLKWVAPWSGKTITEKKQAGS